MTQAIVMILRAFSAFFVWWFGELAALVPDGLRARLRGDGKRLLVEVSSSGKQFYSLCGGNAELLADNDFSVMTANKRSPISAILALPRSEIVRRSTQLPFAAEENLREVVGFEMDRLTPFAREDVYYSCFTTDRDAKSKCIRVEVLLAPRDTVDSFLEALADEGINVTTVDIAGPEPGSLLGINLLPVAPRTAPSKRYQAMAGLLTLASAALLFLAIQIPLDRKTDYAAALAEQVKAERVRVTVLQNLEQQIVELRKPEVSLVDLKHDDALVLPLLDQVTRLLPDDAWLSELSLNGDRLGLSGFSPDSSALVTTFEQTPRFTETVFRAPVILDTRLGLERFSLSLRVVAQEDGQ